MGEIRFLEAQAGDLKVEWDAAKTDEVDNAREFFNKKIKEGYKAYRFKKLVGGKGEQMETFDPEAERVILCKPIVGG